MCIVGIKNRYLLTKNRNKHYRHLVRTPCVVYDIHRENSWPLLLGALHQHGEASEQLLSRQHLFGNRGRFAAMNMLYMEEVDGQRKFKNGVRGSGGGSLRRMGKVLRQYDLTYDLNAMEGMDIYTLLPTEFKRFKQDG